jgi:hypothetical protein
MDLDAYIKGTGYDYPDLPGLGNNNEKLGWPERLRLNLIHLERQHYIYKLYYRLIKWYN